MTSRPVKTAVVVVALLAAGAATTLVVRRNRSTEPSHPRIDALFAPWNRPDSPGCAVAVGHNGQAVYERGYGMANLELDVPITPASAFQAASISKQFTAMSIMLLVQQGVLSLDDDVRKYLPEMPEYGSRLTIRHLLNHTSGLRDAFLIFELSAPEDGYGDRNDVLLKQLARQRSLNYVPGTESQYNNGGYVLAAIVVKRVSGQSLAEFAESNIFRPLGMTSTWFQDDPAIVRRNRASNYRRDAGRWRFVPFGTQPGAVGNSGLWTTTGDLLRWANNLANARVGAEAILAEMQRPSGVTSPDPTQWGLGFEIAEHRDARFVGHGGGDRGIDNYFAWYPEQRLAIAVLCNTDDTGSKGITQRIAESYLPAAEPTVAVAPPSDPPVKLVNDQLESKAGLYRETTGDTFVRTFVRDGELRLALGTGTFESFKLTPLSETRFVIAESAFTFDFVSPGRSKVLHSYMGTTRTGAFERVEPFVLSPAQLRLYAGLYRSDELNAEWNLAEHGATLVIQRLGNADTVVEPLAADTFTTIGDFMRFSRDSSGKITGFTLVASGARGLQFQRVTQ
jgi:CubicO group peptidase (beta-lactamase class C family)